MEENDNDTGYTDILDALEAKILEYSELVKRKEVESELATANATTIGKFIIAGRKDVGLESDPVKALKKMDGLQMQLLNFLQQQPSKLMQEKAYYTGQIDSSRELINAITQKQANEEIKQQVEEDLKAKAEDGTIDTSRKPGERPEKVVDVRKAKAEAAKDSEEQ